MGFAPPGPTAVDLLFGPIFLIVSFVVAWLAFGATRLVLTETIVAFVSALSVLLTVPFDPLLMAASAAGFALMYWRTRRNPIPPLPGFRCGHDPVAHPPQDDVEFFLFAEAVARAERSVSFQRRMELRSHALMDFHWMFVSTTVGMFRSSPFWALIAASSWLWMYTLVWYTMPRAVGAAFMGVFSALVVGAPFGLLMKRRRARKLLR